MSNTDFSKNLRTGKELLLPKDLIGLKAAIGLPTFFSSPAMACVISSGLRWGKLWDVRMLRMVIWILGSAQLLSTLCLASLGEEVGEAILGGGEAVKGDDGDDGLTMQDFSRFASRCSAAAGRCSPAEAVRFNASLGEEMTGRLSVRQCRTSRGSLADALRPRVAAHRPKRCASPVQ